MSRPGGGSPMGAAERAVMDGLFSDAGRADPAAVLASAGIPGCRYAFVDAVLRDPRFVATVLPPSDDVMFGVIGRFMSRLPPDRHRAIRSRFGGLFTPRRVETYRETITDRVATLIDALPERGPVDLVPAFSHPLPFAVIADVLGIPPERHAWVAERMDAFGRAVAGQRERSNVEAGNAAVTGLLEYFDQALTDRAGNPREDLLTLLASEPASGPGRHDLLANCIFFILAGHVTATVLLSAGVHLLATHPAQLAGLLEHPEAWPAAVEELLRFVSPTTLTGNTATADAVVAGCPVTAGEHLLLAFAGASRDPGVFAEPDAFDVTRRPNPHLAFSAGAHHCLGAPLARMHATIALPALFTRLPGLRPIEPPTWLGSTPVRQIAALHVTWN